MFYEWNEQDAIEHIRKIPVFLVSSNTLSVFMNYKVQVTKDFLTLMENKTEIYDKRKKEILKYACLLTDGRKTLGVEFNNDGYVMYRSFLLLDEEEETLCLARKLKETSFEYKKCGSFRTKVEMTRKEEEMTHFLKYELRSIYQKKDLKKLRFLYEEYFNEKEDDFQKMYKNLKENLERRPSSKEEKLYHLMNLANCRRIS